jgi:uncharacterized protein YcaQ
MKLSQRDARKLFLKQQGLLRDNEFGCGKQATMRALQRLSYLQIDTISVVNRAHEHILQTRIENYRPAHLDELYRERHIFEYWGHAASFIPFEAYRYSLPMMRGWRDSRQCDRKLAARILARIRDEGPLASRDFEDTRTIKTTGWWDGKPAKQVLQHLFFTGDLMISHRDGFQKVFDLKERVIPNNIDTSEPTLEQWCEYLILSMVDALGVATENDLGYAKPTIRRLAKVALKAPLKDAIDRLLEDGQLIALNVDDKLHYSTQSILEQLPVRVNRTAVKLLSPFDNLVINRPRTNNLFNFDYLLECYVPEAKRQYGYFALPILYGDELVGRVDTKADRATHRLLLKNLVLEPTVSPDDKLVTALINGIKQFADTHGSEQIEVLRTTPSTLASRLKSKFAA